MDSSELRNKDSKLINIIASVGASLFVGAVAGAVVYCFSNKLSYAAPAGLFMGGLFLVRCYGRNWDSNNFMNYKEDEDCECDPL